MNYSENNEFIINIMINFSIIFNKNIMDNLFYNYCNEYLKTCDPDNIVYNFDELKNALIKKYGHLNNSMLNLHNNFNLFDIIHHKIKSNNIHIIDYLNVQTYIKNYILKQKKIIDEEHILSYNELKNINISDDDILYYLSYLTNGTSIIIRRNNVNNIQFNNNYTGIIIDVNCNYNNTEKCINNYYKNDIDDYAIIYMYMYIFYHTNFNVNIISDDKYKWFYFPIIKSKFIITKNNELQIGDDYINIYLLKISPNEQNYIGKYKFIYVINYLLEKQFKTINNNNLSHKDFLLLFNKNNNIVELKKILKNYLLKCIFLKYNISENNENINKKIKIDSVINNICNIDNYNSGYLLTPYIIGGISYR